VDDQPENRLLLVTLLKQVGLDVQEAASGAAALALWQDWHPHLVWMDIRMPDLDGLEVTRRIRAVQGRGGRTGGHGDERRNDEIARWYSGAETSPPPIIIALTAQASTADRDRAIAAGCDDYISKPFQVSTLFHKLAEHLGLRYTYGNDRPSITTDTPDRMKPLTPVDLAVMPKDWVIALYETAIGCEEENLDALIEQIPPEHAFLANSLKKLTQNFAFDKIMHLTKLHLNGNQVP
jgi:CheY-like chemotaxis protein